MVIAVSSLERCVLAFFSVNTTINMERILQTSAFASQKRLYFRTEQTTSCDRFDVTLIPTSICYCLSPNWLNLILKEQSRLELFNVNDVIEKLQFTSSHVRFLIDQNSTNPIMIQYHLLGLPNTYNMRYHNGFPYNLALDRWHQSLLKKRGTGVWLRMKQLVT